MSDCKEEILSYHHIESHFTTVCFVFYFDSWLVFSVAPNFWEMTGTCEFYFVIL